jgi:hypothetical protein
LGFLLPGLLSFGFGTGFVGAGGLWAIKFLVEIINNNFDYQSIGS